MENNVVTIVYSPFGFEMILTKLQLVYIGEAGQCPNGQHSKINRLPGPIKHNQTITIAGSRL